ncbi:RICIN domain-containing protein [Paenibacillus methanolicus]|uniref:Fibronectin type III domain protein n=1 Tax=Paenibacillus methanolicus TaxID=582686 RepID=A0A5S5CHG9_9BACL|nr:RICIN domain-containing protein [Paenibacillus methanolicus]TYP77473.1 fibronectin type III domain protein [Paenibacillus methanolicus]
MNLDKKGKRCQRFFLGVLCFMVTVTTVLGFGSSDTAHAAVSPLITPYKPQAVNADTNASYTDANGNTVSATIHHPGIAMSLADLDNMRDHVRAGDEPWNTAFQAFAADPQSRPNPRILYEAGNDLFVNIRGPWAFTDENGKYWANPSDYVGTRANTDALVAFKQAVMWYITGDETYRSSAMSIIRAYSGIQSVAPHTSFRFATMTYLLAAAAEIMRYSDTQAASLKWSSTDTQNFTNMMELCSVTYNPHSFFMNQHQFTVMGTMARAIFTNDLEMYAEAVEATMVNAAGDDGGRNGSIKHEMRWMTTNEMTGEPLDPSDYHVQLMEMGRDVGHAYANIAGLSTLAQTIYAQGTKVDPVDGTMSTAANAVNPFNFLEDRLLAGTTYALKYHLGYDVPWTPAAANQSYAGQIFDKINPDLRGRIDGFNSVLYNYYKYIEGQDMTQEKFKYLAYAYETRMPEVAGKDYPLATLLYTPDAAKADGLSNKITLGSITGLKATAAGSNTIYLSWTAVPGALGYNIYRSTDPNGIFTKVSSAPTAATLYRDTNLTPDTTYYYQVQAAGGSKSAAANATTGETSGTASIRFSNAGTGLYIDGIGRTSNGSAAGQWSSSTSNNQRWIEETDGNYVRFKDAATGLYLDGMGRTMNGSAAGQWSLSTSNNQQWSVSIDGSKVRIQNRATGLYLDGMGRKSEGADLGHYGGGRSANQRWQVVN